MITGARPLIGSICLLLLCAAAPALHAHGGVVRDADLCIIKVGYLEAHFKIYLPRRDGHRQFCEDLPASGETLFVMEYVHSGFSVAPIDFRIIRNTTGLGRFARPSDVDAVDDIDDITVFHQPATLSPDVFTVVVDLDSPGEYIGVVTARHPDARRSYQAVFPFTVGFTGFGIWPWLALFMIYVLGNAWVLLRGVPFARWWRPEAVRPAAGTAPARWSSPGS